MRKIILLFMICLKVVAWGEIKVKIHEPIRFQNVNTKQYGDIIVGQGAIEIYSTAMEEDMGKMIKIKFPEQGLMTNKKRWLKVEKYKIAKADEKFVIDREKRLVNFYAFIRRRELNKTELDGTKVEGEYLGYAPILIEEYGKPINAKPMPLPETKPAIRPEVRPMPLPLNQGGK